MGKVLSDLSRRALTRSLCVLAMLLLSSACATEGAQTTAIRAPVTPTAAVPTLTADRPATIAATPSPTVPATETAGPTTPTPTITPSPVPTSDLVTGWLVYENEFLGYRFSYPPEATIGTHGVTGFPTDELPEGMTAAEYQQQLEETYPDDLCVGVGYKVGFVTFIPPDDAGGRYTSPCGVTGVGAYDLYPVSETVVINGQTYTVGGTQLREQTEEATWVSEFYTLRLDDGLRIDFGQFTGTEEEFLEVKETLLQIVSTFRPQANAALSPTPRPTFEPLNLPLPLPDWEWHESVAKSYAFMMPQSWEYRPSYHYRTYKSPETATLISVDVHSLPAGADWLEWLRENQERMLPANPLSPELVTPNAILRGRPAFFRHAEAHSGTAPQFVLVADDQADDQDPLIQDRLIRFYLHSGAIPPLAEELQIFRTIIETFVLRDSPEAETTLPADW